MMAHELPLKLPPKPKVAKEKARLPRLPNGEAPNFGHAKEKTPSFPNEELSSSDVDRKPKKGKKKNASKTSGKKSPTNTEATTNLSPHAMRKDDSYAGSLFHLSPEALALPKPLFRLSPRPANAVILPVMPTAPTAMQAPQTLGHTQVPNFPPTFIYQGMPPAAPPRHPVTAYPAAPYGGFHYSANPQGFINYLYPPSAVPQPPIPMQSFPLGAPMQPHYQPQGQKITFNELMGSK